jgi:hypothetical protein
MSLIDTLKSKKVLLVLHPDFPIKDSVVMGIYPEHLGYPISAKVLDTDDLGIWVENPHLGYENKSGKIKISSGVVLLKWEYILSIVYINDQDLSDSKSQIGFKPSES